MKGTWTGKFDQNNFGNYPMVMEVQKVDGCNFSGILKWPTLRNSVTTMKGSLKDGKLVWTETSLLQGSGIILNGQYVVPLTGKDKLSGEWFQPNGKKDGTFTISKRQAQATAPTSVKVPTKPKVRTTATTKAKTTSTTKVKPTKVFGSTKPKPAPAPTALTPVNLNIGTTASFQSVNIQLSTFDTRI